MLLHATPRHRPRQGESQVCIHQGQQTVKHLDNGHLYAKSSKDVGKLDADHTTADDDHPFGQVHQLQGAGRVDDAGQIETWQGQARGARTGGDHDMLGFHPLQSVAARHFQRSWGE